MTATHGVDVMIDYRDAAGLRPLSRIRSWRGDLISVQPSASMAVRPPESARRSAHSAVIQSAIPES